MTEEERTVEVEADPETVRGDEPRTREPSPAVYGGDDLTTEFNDRVDGATTEGLGRVVGLTRETDGLTLAVETDDGRVAEFDLADPADGRLDGRLRQLFHQIGGAEGDAGGGLVPLTTVDGEVAIDWERVPAAPTNPSLDDGVERATASGDSTFDRSGTWAGAAAAAALLAGVASVSAGVALGAALLAGANPALVGVAALQIVVAGLLVVRAGGQHAEN